MAKDSKNKSSTSISKEEKKKLKKFAKEEKLKNKMIEKEEKRRSKEEKRKSKEELKKNKSATAVDKEEKKDKKELLKKTESSEANAKNKTETRSVRSATGREDFTFTKSRFVMPRAQKGYVFPVTPGPARYPITRIDYPVMKARRQVDLTKKMIAGPSPPAYTMGIKHTEFREFYNKIQ